MNKPLAHITTFGCQMNEYDSARMACLLEEMGFGPAPSQEAADVILLNTCSVRELAEHKVYSALGALRKLKRRKPKLIIGVTGCVAQQEGKRMLGRVPHLNFVLGTAALDRLPEMIEDAGAGKRRAETAFRQPDIDRRIIVPEKPGLQAHITVMTGCDNFCTYCVVPYVRGREKSRSAAEIVAEAHGLASRGTREIMLLGQNVDSYRDPDQGFGFAGLLERVAAVDGVWRVRFMTSHPKDMGPELVEAVAGIPEVMEQVHLPVQSGNDEILAAMNRGYTRATYLAKVEALRKAVPDISLGSDLIVGFPGESEEAFQDTLSIVRDVGYDMLFCFMYSDRPLTKARKMEGKISDGIKARRLQELLDIYRNTAAGRNKALVGSVQEVLVEGPAKKGADMVSGRARGGQAVNFPGSPELAGSLVRVKITQGRTNSLVGRLIEPAEGN